MRVGAACWESESPESDWSRFASDRDPPRLACGAPGGGRAALRTSCRRKRATDSGSPRLIRKLLSSCGNEVEFHKNIMGQFAENETNEVNFREIPSHVLSKVCMYFTYKVRYTNSSTEIPEFPIAPEIALELLMAANFLDC
uniref:Elongin-C n=2 Tax=Boreoeutheria TaxID=1437010 RepID=A0A9L0SAZ0_HORSE